MAYQYAWRGPSDVSHTGVHCPGWHHSGQRRQESQPSSIFSSVVHPQSMVHENMCIPHLPRSHRWTPRMWWTRDVHRRTHSWLEGNRYRTIVYVSETELTQHLPGCFVLSLAQIWQNDSVNSFLPLYHHDWSYRPNKGGYWLTWPMAVSPNCPSCLQWQEVFFDTYIINKTL